MGCPSKQNETGSRRGRILLAIDKRKIAETGRLKVQEGLGEKQPSLWEKRGRDERDERTRGEDELGQTRRWDGVVKQHF
jgi:hypothetical protein